MQRAGRWTRNRGAVVVLIAACVVAVVATSFASGRATGRTRSRLPALRVFTSSPLHNDCFDHCAGVVEFSNSVDCPGEALATGGGVVAPAGFPNAVVVSSTPRTRPGTTVPTGWEGRVRYTVVTDSAAEPLPDMWVVCAVDPKSG